MIKFLLSAIFSMTVVIFSATVRKSLKMKVKLRKMASGHKLRKLELPIRTPERKEMWERI